MNTETNTARQVHTKITATVDDICVHLSQGHSLTAHINRIMTAHFGSDANGNWDRRMAYDMCETAISRFIHQYGRAILSQKDPATILGMLQKVQHLMPTETVRSENQVKLQQFSTPITVGYLVYLASGLQTGDTVIEPSAGTGMLACFARAMGNSVVVNEIDDFRFSCLKTVYDNVLQLDAKYLADLLPEQRADVIVMNPPFAGDNDGKSTHTMNLHITNAVNMLKPNGRLVLITGDNFSNSNNRYTTVFNTLDSKGSVVFTGGLPHYAFAKTGTSFDTRMTVFDKGVFGVEKNVYHNPEGTYADMAVYIQTGIPARTVPTALLPTPPQVGDLFSQAVHAPVAKPVQKANKAFVQKMPTMGKNDVVEVAYSNSSLPKFLDETVGMYQNYEPQVLQITDAKAHPSELVQSMAMASIAPPACTYKPKTYAHVISEGILSAAQLETVIYAGEQHSKYINGLRKVDDTNIVFLTDAHDQDGVKYRKGYFLGDGTGCGKGRQVAGIILDNFLNGRTKALWVSKSDKLYEDAIRDWTAVGGHKTQVFHLNKIKANASIPHDSGILFTTYATLRGGETETRRSRLAQIIEWVGKDFDGVVVFDESHALANALSSQSDRGVKKASAQGTAGLKLQNQLPEARFVYVSATGATSVANLAYADRLGLWASEDFPFANPSDFAHKMSKGGVAAMEVISRDLKALGLYTARSLSYAGVEVDVLKHDLTEQQISIYDTYADAYKQIHNHLEQALCETKIIVGNATANKNAKAAAKSAFESNKQRFFNQILTAMKCPSLFKAIDADLENDKSVVIQIVTTGGAILDRRLQQIPKSEWNDLQIDLTPREYMVDYLQNAFPTRAMKTIVDEHGNTTSEPMCDAQGNPVFCQEAVALRDSMLHMVYSLPPLEGALDQIIKRYGHETVAEVTGRGKRVVINKAGNLCVQNRPTSANINETNAFMDGDKRILIFSDAGGTGRSYHADVNCKNQQQRIHYLLEPGWRADNAVQGLGRTNRTNQASYPVFRPVTTDVKGERRFISTIAKRLDGLGAITRGQRDTGGQGMFSADDNLETDYARNAMHFLLRDIYHGKAPISMTEFADMTALKLTDGEGMLKTDLPPITQVLNRILALRIDDQNKLFEIFNTYLDGVIENAKVNGTYEQGVKHMQALSFKVVNSEGVYEHAKDQQTVCMTIARKDATQFNDWQKLSFHLHAKWVMNSQSGNVAVLLPANHITTEAGEVRQRVSLHRVASTESMDVDDYLKSNWQEIDKDQFIPLWEQQIADTPKYQKSQFKMIAGVMLPVWHALPDQQMEIKRLITDDGQTVLGRMINDEGLNTFYRKMNIDKSVKFNLANAIQSVQTDGKATVTTGLTVKSVWVNYSDRYEVIHTCLPPHQVQILCNDGAFFTEIINYQKRLFIACDNIAHGMDKLARMAGVV